MNDGIAKIADFGFAKKSQYNIYYIVHHFRSRNTMWVVLYICLLRLLRRISIQLRMIYGL